MRAGLCALAVLVFFLSSANAELAWKFATGGEVGMKPLFQDGTMVFGSADGSIYFVSSQSGVLIKKQEVGREIRELKSWNAFLIGSSGSEVVILDGNGTLLRTFNESIVYGIAAADKIYATTSSGMKAYNYDGTISWTISERETMTKPLVSADSVVYGSGSTLVVLDKNGTIKNRIRVAEFWNG